MTKYNTSLRYRSLFGMDVHARSITVKGVDLVTGETVTKRFGDVPSALVIAEWIKKTLPKPHYVAYESGCTGFHLCRELRECGIDCDVIAVSSIARSADDRQRKTDKRDAKRLLNEMCMPTPSYSVVWTPDKECEALRDLVRARLDIVAANKRSKQQTLAFLLRHGYVWNEKTANGNVKSAWTVEFWKWLDKISLGDTSSDYALRSYKRAITENTSQLKDIEKVCHSLGQSMRWKPYVDSLSLLKGIDKTSALLLACEIGDFSRFKNGRSLSKWLGTVPKEHSSGEHIVRGAITKAGNSHCRYMIIEGLNNIARFSSTPKTLSKDQVVSAEVIAKCSDANRRLHFRYRHLSQDSKIGTNKAKVAIASELIRWVWIIGKHVQEEQALNV